MHCVTRHLRRLLARENLGDLADGVLLDRFVIEGDESAFEVLVRRHAGLVLGICRRVLGDRHAAEDAFQATFLVLARQAAAIRRQSSVASWLFAVAYRAALRARAAAHNRFIHESQVGARLPTGPSSEVSVSRAETRAVLDEELRRLPDKYRSALVLCYMEGMSRSEAAQQLGWKPGAVKIRLERGRDLLRQRLTRRGLVLSSAALTLLLEVDSATASASAALVDSTVQAAVWLTTGQAAAGGVGWGRALALAEGMRNSMLMTRIKIATAILWMVGSLSLATSWLGTSNAGTEPPVQPGHLAAAEPANDAVVGIDAAGDPQPPGATRLGTLRGRHDSTVTFVGYAGDGKYLITASQAGAVRVLDASNGKEVCEILKPLKPAGIAGNPLMMMPVNAQLKLAIAADGQTLAVASPEAVALYEISTGKQLGKWKGGTPTIWALAFAPDNKSLSATRLLGKTLVQWDLEGTEIGKFEASSDRLTGPPLAFSPDGKIIATPSNNGGNQAGGNLGKPQVQRWDVASGKQLSPVNGAETPRDQAVLAPNLKIVAWTSRQTNKVRLWDMENDKELRKVDGALALAFSADAKLMAGLDEEQGVALWDTETGKLLRKLPGTAGIGASGRGAGPISIFMGGATALTTTFSKDGKHIAVGIGTVVRQWEVATGKEVGLAAGHGASVVSLALSADGKTVATRGADRTVRVWGSTGKELTLFSIAGGIHAAFSADGRFLAQGNGADLILWDVQAAKKVNEWKAPDKGLVGFAFSENGKIVATRHGNQTIRLWDSQTGKELRHIADSVVNLGGANAPTGGVGDTSDLALLFAPDAAILAALPQGGPNGVYAPGRAVPKDNAIHIYDVSAGKLVRRFDDAKSFIVGAAYSTDLRTIATANSNGTISLWEVATGKERFQFKTETMIHALAWSADGKFLVGTGYDGIVRFWDAVSGKELAQRKGHQSGVTSIALSRDGRTLVSGSADTTALVWEVPALEVTQLGTSTLDAKQAEQLWADLASSDPAKAHQAMRALVAAASQSLPLFKDRLKPVPEPDLKHIASLIADLESKEFAVRQNAEDELEKLGDLAEPALQKVLDSKPGLQTLTRVENLLGTIVTVQVLPVEQLQAMRALAVVEQIDTREARQILEAVAKGASGARLTKEAKGALGRLAK
jgi:RNA polymerase sigma factor (sigma-70 family)